MSLLKDVEGFDPNAARVLEEADLRSNFDLQSLTREDLQELFPGPKCFKLRREILDRIHREKPVDAVIRELKGFIPSESVRAALTNTGVLVDYLHILKDMKTHMSGVQDFLHAHVDLLEEFCKDQPNQEPDKANVTCSGVISKTPAVRTSTHLAPTMMKEVPPGDKGRLMEKVKDCGGQEVQFVESGVDHQITVVFCPIIFCNWSDFKDAMSDVKDNKPVILVWMHHTLTPKDTIYMLLWRPVNTVLHVNVFFHLTKSGLLTCDENDFAVSEIRDGLLRYGLTSQDAMDVGGTSGTAVTARRDGSKNQGSNSDTVFKKTTIDRSFLIGLSLPGVATVNLKMKEKKSETDLSILHKLHETEFL